MILLCRSAVIAHGFYTALQFAQFLSCREQGLLLPS